MFDQVREEIEVRGRDLLGRVKEVVHAGNDTHIVIKDRDGETFAQFPATVGVIGAFVAPVITILGAVSVLVAKFGVGVERSQSKTPGTKQHAPKKSISIR
jgi:hypothetical protein